MSVKQTKPPLYSSPCALSAFNQCRVGRDILVVFTPVGFG